MPESMREKARGIFLDAVELSAPERAALIASSCGDDVALRAEVEALLTAFDSAAGFMASPTAGDVTVDATTRRGVIAANAAPLHEGPGTRIGPYTLLQLIGEGGFGSVFMAEQVHPVKRFVALKIIKLGMDTRQVVARFEQERQALALMDHPNIAKVLDAGATETGRPYFVMELVKGEPITHYCDRQNLSISERLDLFAQVCTAVQHAHTKGIIHRDIKPTNVLVSTHDGRPHAKVIDFGIAKATASKLTEKTLFTEHQQLIGTPQYMSPEQAEGSLDIDTRTDVYSLGVLLYELLTGSTPFLAHELRSAAYAEIQRIIREVEPPRPSTRLNQNTGTIASVAAQRRTEPRKLGPLIRGELDWIVMKSLEKNRTRRYESASALADDVRRYLSGQAVVAVPPGRAYLLSKFLRRHRGAVVAATAVAAALLIGAIGFAWQAQVAAHQRDLALAAQSAERDRAEGERVAKHDAERRLAQVKRANEILSSVFRSLDPREIASSGRPLQAILVEHLDQAAADLVGETVGDPLVVAEMQLDLAASLEGLGEPRKAIALLEKAHETFRRILGENANQALVVANDLAMAQFSAGDTAAAQRLMEATLAARKSAGGIENVETITCMNNLALIYNATKQAAAARDLLTAALELRKKVNGPDHPETANAMHNLGLARIESHDLADAASLFEEALRIRRATIGADHPYTLATMKELSNCYSALGEVAKARPLLSGALERAERALGRDHPTSLAIATTLARSYYQAGEIDKLQNLLEITLPAMRSKLGGEHPDTLSAAGNLAATYWMQKRLDKSIPLFEETSRAYEKTLGRRDPQTIDALANLGINYVSAHRFQDALPILEEVHAASSEQGAGKFAIQSLLDAYVGTNQPERASAIFPEVLTYTESATPPRSPQRGAALTAIGDALLRAKLYVDAESVLRDALALREKLRPDDWTTFNTRSLLGGALLGQGSAAAAEPLLLSAYEGLVERANSIPPAAADRLPAAADRLIALYTALDRPDEVKKWQTERAKYESTTKPQEK